MSFILLAKLRRRCARIRRFDCDERYMSLSAVYESLTRSLTPVASLLVSLEILRFASTARLLISSICMCGVRRRRLLLQLLQIGQRGGYKRAHAAISCVNRVRSKLGKYDASESVRWREGARARARETADVARARESRTCSVAHRRLAAVLTAAAPSRCRAFSALFLLLALGYHGPRTACRL